jgi:asparagine synthase (glutamine-hydrolysing)
MCGIFGCFLNRPLNEEDLTLCRSGRNALRHRGPDSCGEWYDRGSGVYLGHTRLSILDLSEAANQPLGLVHHVIAFNGEIYNFQDLRRDLKSRGFDFRSTGDTEVLLRGWTVWGEQVLDRLDGMFAFAIYDGARAYLAVDPFGEKQLYWAETREGIYVSSELSPLAALLEAEVDISEEKLSAYLSLGYIPAPATIFKKVYRLPAAHLMTCEQGRVKEVHPYWRHPVGIPGRGRVIPPGKGDLDRILDALVESVRGRLLADVPLCLFLSSGTDSPLVAAIAKKELGVDLHCLTVSFPRGQVADESAPAARIARHLDLEAEAVESDEDPTRAGARAVLDLFGQPNSNITVVSCYQISKAAAPRYKVALTGMGGDEIFCGYDKHAFFYRYRRLYAMPQVARFALGRVTSGLVRGHSRLAHFGPLLAVREWEFYLANKNYPCIGWLRKLPAFEGWAHKEFGTKGPPEFAVPFYEVSQVMQNSQLPALDLGSMRASLELRTPFLNRKLNELLAQLDPRIFMAFGQKYVLRQLLSRYIPPQLTEKRKLGFIFPRDQFLKNYSGSISPIPILSEDLAEEVWQKRNRARGWADLAVRLLLLGEFLSFCSGRTQEERAKDGQGRRVCAGTGQGSIASGREEAGEG